MSLGIGPRTDFGTALLRSVAVITAVSALLFLAMYHVNCTKSLRDRESPDEALQASVNTSGSSETAEWHHGFDLPPSVKWIHVYDRYHLVGESQLELCYPKEDDEGPLPTLSSEAACLVWDLMGAGPHQSRWVDGSEGVNAESEQSWYYEVQTEGRGDLAVELFFLSKAPDPQAITESWPCGALY